MFWGAQITLAVVPKSLQSSINLGAIPNCRAAKQSPSKKEFNIYGGGGRFWQMMFKMVSKEKNGQKSGVFLYQKTDI